MIEALYLFRLIKEKGMNPAMPSFEELAFRFTRISIHSGNILGYQPDAAMHPIYEASILLRGFNPQKFISWANRVVDSLGTDADQKMFGHLFKETMVYFKRKFEADPKSVLHLLKISRKIEQFMCVNDRNRRRSM